MNIKEHVANVISLLKTTIPSPKTELNFANEMQLAVAVALSAQTTDKKVNEITQTLFKKYLTWNDFANANLQQLQNDIKGVNFHMGKAERLIGAAKVVLNDFNGHLPKTLNQLITIPGVARKSANVILQEMWGISEGIVVDTHITRVSNRLGITKEQKNAVKIEQELIQVVDKKEWQYYSQAIVLHGRYVCKAIKPNCAQCVLNKICPSAFKA